MYLAVVVDAFSRRVVGWAMATHLRAELIIDALNMAIWRRRPEGVIHHSDQGSQYTSIEFGKRCRRAGVSLFMGSRGDCYELKNSNEKLSTETGQAQRNGWASFE